MFRRYRTRKIAADLESQLAEREAQEKMSEYLPPVEAPDAIWTSIETAWQENQSRPARPRVQFRWAFAAILLLLVGGAVYWRLHRPEIRWDVARLDGVPSVGAKALSGTGRIRAGEWIETDGRSRANVKVGEIGFLEVEPNTRVRVVMERPNEHRLALARGEIRATISAPPKLFFVDTAAGTAVDLGCEYALSTDEDGSGLLRVTKGWVSFQWKDLESLVPAGASCRTRAHAGPGIPYFDDAPESFKQAVDNFGFVKSVDGGLGMILSAARVRDTLTLWHLLSRVDVTQRALVYDRIAALTPVPAGISRDLALQLDPDTLRRWKDELAWTW
jgi:FecR-like protein